MADFVFPDVIETAPTATASGSDFVFPDVIETTPRQSNSVGSKLSSIFSALSETGSGAVEGVSGLAGFLADNLSISPSKGNIGTILAAKAREALGGEPAAEALQRAPDGASQQIQSITDAVLPEADPDYRYARRFGQFVGPTVATGGTSPAAILSALTGSAAGQATEDAGGNQWAQLAASIFGGAAPSAVKGVLEMGRNALAGPTKGQILGSAAKVQKDVTGLTASEIDDALAEAAKNPSRLAKLRTTAEITDNAGMGQIEKTLAARPEFANQYASQQSARATLRDEMLSKMTKSKGVNKSALGEELISKTAENKQFLKDAASSKWDDLPEIKIDVTKAGDDILNYIQEADPAGLGFSANTQKLINKVTEAQGEGLSSKAVQSLRSQALKIQRNFADPEKNVADVRMLPKIESALLNATEDAYSTSEAALYKEARAATRLEKSIFGKKTIGEKLTKDGLDPQKALSVFTGSKQSAEQLQIAAALGKNKELADKVNSALIEQMRGNVDKPLTPARVDKFLAKNEEGLKVLLGDRHVSNIKVIAKDLQSQYGLQDRSFGASTGGSVTGQKATVAGAISDAISGSVMPGSGAVGKVANEIRKTIGIDAQAQISELLFKAAMQPTFAKELAMTPTTKTVMNWLQRLGDTLKNMGNTGAKAGAADVLRPEPEAQKTPKATLSLVAPKAPAAAPAPAPKADAVAPISAATEDTGFTAALKAIGFVESRGNKNAVSPKGAIGTHQVMPIAMRDVMRAKGINDKIYSDAQLRQMAAEEGASEYYGTEYVKLLYDRFNGDWPLVFAAYNGGPSLVKKLLKDSGGDSFDDIKSRLPSETRNYVPAVQAALSRITKA